MLETGKIQQKRNFFDRLLGLVVEPSSTFKYVVKNPDLLLPLVMIALVSLVNIPVTELALEQTGQLIELDLDLAASSIIVLGTLFVSTLIGLLVVMLFRAAIFSILGALLSAKVSFKTNLAIAGYLNFPALVNSLIAYGTVKLNGSVDNFSLNFILSPNQITSKLGILLGNITPFTIWYIVLSTFALSHLWATSKKQAFGITIVLWLLVVGISVLGG